MRCDKYDLASHTRACNAAIELSLVMWTICYRVAVILTLMKRCLCQTNVAALAKTLRRVFGSEIFVVVLIDSLPDQMTERDKHCGHRWPRQSTASYTHISEVSIHCRGMLSSWLY